MLFLVNIVFVVFLYLFYFINKKIKKPAAWKKALLILLSLGVLATSILFQFICLILIGLAVDAESSTTNQETYSTDIEKNDYN